MEMRKLTNSNFLNNEFYSVKWGGNRTNVHVDKPKPPVVIRGEVTTLIEVRSAAYNLLLK